MTDFAAVRSSVSIQSAYTRAQELKAERAEPPAQADGARNVDFSQMVDQAAANAIETVRQGDAVATAGLSGRAGIQQVVEATMAMESTVRVSVALRDKLVEAYQEVMRMPI